MDQSAERSALGAMMRTKAALAKGLADLRKDDFTLEAHQLVFDVMKVLHEEGDLVVPLTVIARLKRRNQAATCNETYINELPQQVVSGREIHEAARIVHDLGRLRRIIGVCDDVMQSAYTHEGAPEDLLRDHLGRLQEIAGDCGADRTAQHTSATVETLAERVQRQCERGEEVSAARFGLPWVDKQLNGLEDWGMIVVRAASKLGKSLFAGQATLATAEALLADDSDDRVVLGYVLEAREEWEERAIAWLGRLNKQCLEGRIPMDEGQEQRYEAALHKWSQLPLYVTDRLTHVDEITLDIEQQAMQGRQPALVVIDHFQRVVGNGETATLRYDDAAQKLAQVPRMHKCPLLVPSQITDKSGAERHSMWARRLDQEATVVFDIFGERDEDERILRPTLPRKYIPFEAASYYVSPNFDARLWDQQTWQMMTRG